MEVIILDKHEMAKVCTETSIIALRRANGGITMALLSGSEPFVQPVENFNF